MNDYVIASVSSDSKALPVYMNTVCAHYNQGELHSPNGRDFHQILFVLDGKGTLSYDGKVYDLKKGAAFFTARNVPVSYKSTEGLVVAFLTVNGNAVNDLAKFFNCERFLFRDYVNTEKYLAYINDIIEEYSTHKREGIISALAYSLYVNFFEQQAKEYDKMKEVSNYIEKNFTRRIKLEEISDLFGISVSTLSHNFKKKFGYTVFEYILNLRLTYANTLIQLNHMLKIQDVAFFCGFDDVSYFCKAYKAKFGNAPSKSK